MPTNRRPRALAARREGLDNDFYAPTRTELDKLGVDLILENFATIDEILPFAREVDVIFQGPVPLNRELLAQLPNLKAICALGVGFDDFDVEAATELGIVVINLPRVFHREVAAHAMALLLSIVRQIVPSDQAMHAHAGHPEHEIAYYRPRHHLYGETLGLLAFGNIAREVARMAQGFEIRVITHDPFINQDVADKLGVTLVDFDELFRESDFISVHTPLMKSTRHLVGEAQFRLMKPTSIFINTSRGPVVDEVALTKALQEGWISAAGLDVTEIEPPLADNPLLTMPNVVLTPHIAAGSDREHVERARWMGIEVGQVLNGHWPINGLVNRGVKPRVALG